MGGKTCRGARRADGTGAHVLGVAVHGGHLLDHIEAGIEYSEASHFTRLLGFLDLDGAVTSGAMPCGRHLDWLAKDKKAHYVAIVKRIQHCCTPRSERCPGGRYRPTAAAPARGGTAAPRPAC